MTPRSKERLFRREYAEELLRIAADDLAAARALLQSKNVRRETACFHCQQAIEKTLKSVLVHLGIPVPMVHDAGTLIAKMPTNLTPPKGYDLSELTSFATIRRYEEGQSEITDEEVSAIVDSADMVIAWAKRQIRSANAATKSKE